MGISPELQTDYPILFGSGRKKLGLSYIAQPGGSVRDDHVIETCDKYDIAMAFTDIRLFHH